jgi:hypothetical protein
VAEFGRPRRMAIYSLYLVYDISTYIIFILLTMKWSGKYPQKRFRVPSKSKSGEFHLVEIWDDGEISCDCLAHLKGGRECRHIKRIKLKLRLERENA